MTYTADQIKTQFKKDGRTIVAWSAERGFVYKDVIRVLNGFSKASRGKGHEIAVALGMKTAD
jgi:gp16 family phage-associated protein